MLNASCYTKWLESYEDAAHEYEDNVDRCLDAVSGERCMREADSRFDKQLWDAGNDYIHCVG